MPRGRAIRRGRGGKAPTPGRKRVVAKPPSPPKAWEVSHQKEALSKLLAILQPNTSTSSQTNPATVEYYNVSEIIPFLVSRIGKLTTKPSTKSQLHDAIKQALLEDPVGASAPPVDAVYLFCKLLSEGLISLSIKQEVCYLYPPIRSKKEEFSVPQKVVEEWNAKSKTRISREEAQNTLKKIDQKVASMLKAAWSTKQWRWKCAQQDYFEKFYNQLEDTQKYKKLQPHYERVKQWIQKILQKKKEQHTPSQESNNNNNNEEENEESVLSIEFHTHSTSWNFLHTLVKLFRVSRKVDDKLVEELVQAMVEDGLIKIEEEAIRYINKPLQKAPGVPPISPNVSVLFAPTPQAFWEHNKVQIGRNNVINAQNLATLLRLVGNPSTTVSKKAPAVAASPAAKETTRKEGNIFASLAEEIDAATGKTPAKEVEPEDAKPAKSTSTKSAAPAKESKEKKPVDANEFTEVSSSKKKKGKKEPETKTAPAPSTSSSTKPTTTSVVTTSAYSALAVEDEKEKDAPKKKMSSKNKKKAAALAATKPAEPAPEEPKPSPPVKEAPKETKVEPANAKATNPPAKGKSKGSAKEEAKPAEAAKPAKEVPTKATAAPAKASKEPASKAPAKQPEAPKEATSKGKAVSNQNASTKQQNENNNKSNKASKEIKSQETKETKAQEAKQESKKKNKKKQDKPQKSQVVHHKHHHPKRKDVPLVPPALIISVFFVVVLILAAYYLRIDQFLDDLFD